MTTFLNERRPVNDPQYPASAQQLADITGDDHINASIKMMQQQLYMLTSLFILEGNSTFTTDGSNKLLHLWEASPQQASKLFAADNYYPTLGVTSIKTWIDRLRSETGLAAWVWSFGTNNGAIMTKALLDELWNALGYIYGPEHRLVMEYDDTPQYGFESLPGSGPYCSYHPSTPTGADDEIGAKIILEYKTDTFNSGVYNILLFQVTDADDPWDNDATSFDIYYNIDDSTATLAYTDGGDGTVATGLTIKADGDGANAHVVDATAFHPTSGASPFLYRLDIDTVGEHGFSPEIDLTVQSGVDIKMFAYNAQPTGGSAENWTWLWQPGKQ